MKTAIIISLIFFLFSCGRQNEGSFTDSTKDRSAPGLGSNSDSLIVERKTEKDLMAFAILNSDTIYIEEPGKVFSINVLSDTVFAYKVFNSYKDETDFGETTQYIRDNSNNLLWSIKMNEYASSAINNRYVMISDIDRPLVNFYDIKSGNLIEEKGIEFIINDSNQFFASNNNLYILVTMNDGSLKDILRIDCNNSFEEEWMGLNLQGYYSLAYLGPNNVVLMDSNNKVFKELK